MSTEFNRLLEAGLATQLAVTRDMAGTGQVEESWIFVGSGHAERLATAARASGKGSEWIPLPNLSEGEIQHSAKAVREKISAIPHANRQKAVVVYAILDDKLYMARSTDGGQTPCKPPKKNISHVEGKLVIADGSWIREVLGLFKPLLLACEGVEGILLTPIPRYMEGPCCSKPTHMVGYSKGGHIPETLATIHHVRRQLKDTLATMKIKTTRVANLAKTVAESSAGWATPTTPNIGTYQQMVDKLSKDIPDRLAEKATQKGRALTTGSSSPRPGQKRPAPPTTSGPSAKWATSSRGGHPARGRGDRSWRRGGNGGRGGRGGQYQY